MARGPASLPDEAHDSVQYVQRIVAVIHKVDPCGRNRQPEQSAGSVPCMTHVDKLEAHPVAVRGGLHNSAIAAVYRQNIAIRRNRHAQGLIQSTSFGHCVAIARIAGPEESVGYCSNTALKGVGNEESAYRIQTEAGRSNDERGGIRALLKCGGYRGH